MRALAVDFGFKEIGLAVGEVGFGIGSPRNPIKASGALKTDAATLSGFAKKEEADLIVVGLPVEESGEEGRMARICRTLAGHLTDLGHKVEMVDESYTSIQAETNLAEAGVSLKRHSEKVHGEAALLILERYAGQAQQI